MFEFINEDDEKVISPIGKDDYEIKMDGNERTFKDGFVRYTKEGKGRFDLIPMDPLRMVLERLYKKHVVNKAPYIYDKFTILEALSKCDYVEAIIGITFTKYTEYDDVEVIVSTMLKDLAVHFEKGAAKYGVNNWRKATNETWSFIDSGMRHTLQFLRGETDEPHHISAIWNFFCYLEMQKDEKELILKLNRTEPVPLPESWTKNVTLLNFDSEEE